MNTTNKELIEIIRCKDCAGILPEGRKKHKCDIYRMFADNDNFYCAYGRKIENSKPLEKS